MTSYTSDSFSDLNIRLHDAEMDLDTLTAAQSALSLEGTLFKATPEGYDGIYKFTLIVEGVDRWQLLDEARTGQLFLEEIRMESPQELRIEGAGPVVLSVILIEPSPRITLSIDKKPLKIRKWFRFRAPRAND